MSITGRGAQFLQSPLDTSGLLGRGMLSDLQRDLFFGRQGPRWIEIPYVWIAPPMLFRPDTVVTEARVTQTGGPTARATTGSNDVRTFTAELDTACDSDPQACADWAVLTGSTARMRSSGLVFNLFHSAIAGGVHILLGIKVGDRIRITDAPATWPEGTDRLWIEGRQRVISATQDLLRFRTSPMPDRVPGTPDSYITAGGTDPDAIMPF